MARIRHPANRASPSQSSLAFFPLPSAATTRDSVGCDASDRPRGAVPARSLTVLLAMPSDLPISRWLRPSSYFRRSSSRIFRMDNLLCDTLFLLVSGDLGEDGRKASLQQVLERSYSLTPG